MAKYSNCMQSSVRLTFWVKHTSIGLNIPLNSEWRSPTHLTLLHQGTRLNQVIMLTFSIISRFIRVESAEITMLRLYPQHAKFYLQRLIQTRRH